MSEECLDLRVNLQTRSEGSLSSEGYNGTIGENTCDVTSGIVVKAKSSFMLYLILPKRLAWLVLFHVFQSSQNFPPTVTFGCTLVISIEETVIVAANLEPNVERFILVSLSSVTPVAFHTPPVAIAFDDGTDRFVDEI